MKLFIRTIGISRATVKIGMANIAYKPPTAIGPRRQSPIQR
jgi:hypothetical protein